ncbi:urease subunit beta [Micrococcus luteus]|uniref:urease subunit beta n=1 Tax=Micrococcus luteus TaxID=1270 RepID=UPI0001C4FA22|nr:urease subunit beta [Micrococcus luteus]EFD49561.1 urease, beta subunit [Micrococcus luteus SK58]EFD49749.1 urease, beta subunit [Micrococcus luteus SK58]EFD51821.1 urease, beta subunit [Micrococcus luteus SK58]MBU8743409.1 urease subunit beta [Micrococcus luteus]
MKPGEYVLADAPVVCNPGREAVELSVTNRGDRPVQVGSHFHFAEANRALDFDRQAALGCRLDIPAGTAVRLEPGDETTVKLIPLGGDRVVYGFRDMVDGPLDPHEAAGFHAAPAAPATPARHESAAGDAPSPLKERAGFDNETR